MCGCSVHVQECAVGVQLCRVHVQECGVDVQKWMVVLLVYHILPVNRRAWI